MKFYDFTLAPNPQRVRIFMAEKGVTIPTVQVNVRDKEQFSDWFQKLNPHGTIPVLELDDGTCLCESVAICRYIEETHPEPPLMGKDAKDKAVVEMWNRRAEIQGMAAAGEAVRNAAPMFADRAIAGTPSGVPQLPELVARGKQSMERFCQRIDSRLGETEYLAGDDFTIADITAYVAIGFAKRIEIQMPESCKNAMRWYAAVESRPSASA